jgi:hypothetical protein
MTKVHHRTYDRRRKQYDMVRDTLEGEERVNEQGQAYLPKPSAMTQNDYAAYLTRAHYYPVAERTLRGMCGLALRNDPQIKLPPRLERMRQSATFKGHSLDVLIEDLLRETLSVGRIACVLDYPTEGAKPTDPPFISVFDAESILDYKESLVEGRSRLTMLRLREDHDDGEVERHLLYTLEPHLLVRRYEMEGENEIPVGEDLIPTINGKALFTIPAVIISPYNLQADPEKPPFLDLVTVSLSHYRNCADYEHALYLTAQPTPYITGNISQKEKPSTIGSSDIWCLPDGATAGMLEFTGAGVSAIRTAIEDKKNEMASLGARMIHDGINRNESSDTAKMRGRAEMSLLVASVKMVEAALQMLLTWAAEWTGSQASDVSVTLSKDFIQSQMDANTMNGLLKMWQAGAISHETLVENLQRGEIIPADRSFAEEADRIEAEGGDMSQIIPILPRAVAK